MASDITNFTTKFNNGQVDIIVCGTGIFLAIFTLGAALQFWTTDGSEAANAFTYGGSTITQYPLTIYPVEAVKALTFLVPVAFVNWYPCLYLLGRSDPSGMPEAFQFASPLAGAVSSLIGRLPRSPASGTPRRTSRCRRPSRAARPGSSAPCGGR